MSNFNKLRTTRKGRIGETIIRAILERNQCQVYPPPDEEAHIIDFVYFSPRRQMFFAADAKTYPRRDCCNDTGIDKADFDKYTKLNLPVMLFFVDELEATIFCGCLEELRHSATEHKGKVYFPLAALRVVRELSKAELAELAELGKIRA